MGINYSPGLQIYGDKMLAAKRSRTLAIGIERSPIELYMLISNPQNLPRWAAGLCKGVRKSAGGWIVETAAGDMGFKFAGRNDYGIMDHYVTSASGETVYVPMRVMKNGRGSEVAVTIFQGEDMNDEKFDADCRLVDADLVSLKQLAESRTAG